MPKSDHPGTILSSHATDVHDSQPLSPDADVLEPSSPQLLSRSSSTSSSSSSGSSSTTQPSPRSIDDNNDDDDDDDAMDQASQPDIDKIDDSIPGNSPTHSEVQMIEVTTAATQNNNDYQELPEESIACKRPASSPKCKSRSSKKKR